MTCCPGDILKESRLWASVHGSVLSDKHGAMQTSSDSPVSVLNIFKDPSFDFCLRLLTRYTAGLPVRLSRSCLF